MNREIIIRKMQSNDWDFVANIYKQGIDTHKSTFQTDVPSYEEWDSGHVIECRLVATYMDTVVGWIAMGKVSNRCVYKGVAEISIYIDQNYRSLGIGSLLMGKLIKESEKHGYWTLQSGIFEDNEMSIRLHVKHGFRIIGYREKIGKTSDGEWKNTILVERRSAKIF